MPGAFLTMLHRQGRRGRLVNPSPLWVVRFPIYFSRRIYLWWPGSSIEPFKIQKEQIPTKTKKFPWTLWPFLIFTYFHGHWNWMECWRNVSWYFRRDLFLYFSSSNEGLTIINIAVFVDYARVLIEQNLFILYRFVGLQLRKI